jgi:soluble lytic murein transglycosylase-like protein
MTVTRMRRTETATLGSVRKIRSVRKTLEKHRSLRPLVSYALGLAQQGRGEYTTALARYERVFKKSPRHPIAVTAAAQKRRLLTKVDRDVEALAVDAWLVDWAPFGRVHRDALWRVGFDAVMRGDEAAAEQHLARLAHGYGHQRAGTGLIWEAQAGYWLARNADLAGKTTLANARYTTLTQRFPGTWYGRLARQRLGPEAPSSVDPTAIPRAAGLDTVIAYARLGERAEAKQQLWQLRRQGFFRLLGPRVRDAIKPPEPPAVVVTADPSEPAIERSPEQVDAPPQKTPIEPTTPFETHRVALEAAAQEHAVDPTLIAAIAHIETRFRPDAVSRAGAMGMCQLMPATGEAHGKKLYGPDFSADRLTEPEVNFRIAAYHLARVRELVGEHPVMLLAAYNAGRARAVRWHAAFGALPVDAFVERIPFPQARRYVQTVVTAAETMRRTHWPSRLSTAVPLALTPLP